MFVMIEALVGNIGYVNGHKYFYFFGAKIV